jgi:hypothetical protein
VPPPSQEMVWHMNSPMSLKVAQMRTTDRSAVPAGQDQGTQARVWSL